MMDRLAKNQNANETDYEKQFKEDLEKATALSMETIALEQFRRNKSLRLSSESDMTSASTSMKFSSCESIYAYYLLIVIQFHINFHGKQ